MTDLRKAAEPVEYTGNGTAGREANVQPTGFFFQMLKPVGEVYGWHGTGKGQPMCRFDTTEAEMPVGTKLYTTPPQCTWAGLTDADIAQKPPVKTYCGGKPNYCEPIRDGYKINPVAWIKIRELSYMKAVADHGKHDWQTNLGLKPEPDDEGLYTETQVQRMIELLERCENEMRYAGWTKFESDNPARNGVYEQVKEFLK